MAGRDPRSPEGDLGPQTGGGKGVAPGHDGVFAAYSFRSCSIGCCLVFKYLAFPSAERDPERDAEHPPENPVPRFMPDSLQKCRSHGAREGCERLYFAGV